MFRIDRPSIARFALAFGLVMHGASALAADLADPPGRVGRLSDVQGKVWLYDQEERQWVEGLRNRALTSGDRLSTERGSRAEVRVGSTELRIDGDAELELERIDDDRMVFRLAAGTLALRVRSREIAREVEVRSARLRILPERSGHYRIDRDDDTTWVSAWRGALRVDTGDQQVQVAAGRRAEFQRDGRDGATLVSWSAPENDVFSDWVARDERNDDRSLSRQYVSPEMTGVEDLDRYGRWERHPEFGMVWAPVQVVAGWAPYRHGRWAWSVTWGWTWVDEAPWGFAPFHYGRWVHWGGRWCWSPGAYVARPVFAPALVAWVGGPSAGVSVTIGGHSGPPVGWMPLSPRDAYVPSFRHAPRYYERVNQPHHNYHPPQVPTGPIMYGNRGVPDAVTVVPADVLRQRQPVAGAAVRGPDAQRVYERERFHADAPVPLRGAAPAPRVVAAPGGAEPVRVPPPPGRENREPRDDRDSRGGLSPRVIDLRRERPMPAPGAASPAPQPQATSPAPVRVPQAVPAAPVPAERPARPERIDRPEPQGERPDRGHRPERTDRVDRAPAAPVAPVVVSPPPVQPTVVPRAAPAKPEPKVEPPRQEPRAESREEGRGRDNPRTPESRQNQRDRQNQQ